MVTPNRQSYSTQQNNLNSGINTGNRITEAHSSGVNNSLPVGYLTHACCTVSDALCVTASSHITNRCLNPKTFIGPGLPGNSPPQVLPDFVSDLCESLCEFSAWMGL